MSRRWSFLGKRVTNEASSPNWASDTATLASPPPKVISRTGAWLRRRNPGVARRSMTSPKVTTFMGSFEYEGRRPWRRICFEVCHRREITLGQSCFVRQTRYLPPCLNFFARKNRSPRPVRHAEDRERQWKPPSSQQSERYRRPIR